MTFKNIDKKKCMIYIFLFILGFFIFLIVYLYAEDDEDILVKENIKEESNLIKNKEIKKEKYKVDIKGAVVNPGIYEVDNESRISDVINLSGGLKENADTNYINLSKKVVDEMVIIIYTKEEISNMNNNTAVKFIDKECICPSIKNDGCIGDNKVTNQKENNPSSNITSIININTATLEELMNLPGIGESKASEIIKYREKTPFTKIEDLLNVNGIGKATFEKLKNNITV